MSTLSGKVESFDPTPQVAKGPQQDMGQFIQQLIQNPQAFGLSMQNPLAGQAGYNMGAQMADPNQNLEGRTFQQMSPGLMNIAAQQGQQQANPFAELQFGRQTDPFGGFNAVNNAMATLGAATPIFDRNLQQANAQMNAAAPGRFSSALAMEGADLNSRALQDFNLFAQQAMGNALGLEAQERAAQRNFALGSQGLMQEGALGARNLQQGAEFQNRGLNQSGAVNAANIFNTLMQGAGTAANGQFNRNLNLGQFGLAQQQANMNPVIQLLLGAMGWTQPMGQEAIVHPSILGQVANAGMTAAQIYGMTKGNNNGQFSPNGPGQIPQQTPGMGR